MRIRNTAFQHFLQMSAYFLMCLMMTLIVFVDMIDTKINKLIGISERIE